MSKTKKTSQKKSLIHQKGFIFISFIAVVGFLLGMGVMELSNNTQNGKEASQKQDVIVKLENNEIVRRAKNFRKFNVISSLGFILEGSIVSSRKLPQTETLVSVIDPQGHLVSSNGFELEDLIIRGDFFNLGIKEGAAISKENPYFFSFRIEKTDFITETFDFFIEDLSHNQFTIRLKRLDNPPIESSSTQGSSELFNGKSSGIIIDNELGIGNFENLFQINIPKGVEPLVAEKSKISSRFGQKLEYGALYTPPTKESSQLNSNNLITLYDAVREDGERVAKPSSPLDIISHGQINLEMKVDGREVVGFSKPVKVTLPLVNGLINPKTQEPFQFGDSIQVIFRSKTGGWIEEKYAKVDIGGKMSSKKGNLIVSFLISRPGVYYLFTKFFSNFPTFAPVVARFNYSFDCKPVGEGIEAMVIITKEGGGTIFSDKIVFPSINDPVEIGFLISPSHNLGDRFMLEVKTSDGLNLLDSDGSPVAILERRDLGGGFVNVLNYSDLRIDVPNLDPPGCLRDVQVGFILRNGDEFLPLCFRSVLYKNCEERLCTTTDDCVAQVDFNDGGELVEMHIPGSAHSFAGTTLRLKEFEDDDPYCFRLSYDTPDYCDPTLIHTFQIDFNHNFGNGRIENGKISMLGLGIDNSLGTSHSLLGATHIFEISLMDVDGIILPTDPSCPSPIP